MYSVFSVKIARLLLSASISIWMAGGCLFGCANTAMAAESKHEVQTVVASSHSCHAARLSNSTQQSGVPSFAPVPSGMMKDCPLVMNATAVASKKSGHLPDRGRAPVYALPLIEKRTEESHSSNVVAYLPNRGPTHLRCCVFLI